MGGEILVRRMTNAIRPGGVASLRVKGEAQPRSARALRKRFLLRGSVRKRGIDAIRWLATERDRGPCT